MSVSSVTRSFIDGTYGQIHLRSVGRLSGDSGDKPPIICLHMIPKSGRGFARLMPQLAKDRFVIAPDYPGYGESAPYPDDFEPTIGSYADAIEDVISHFEIDRVHLLGYHTGSMVAVELAHRLEQVVEKLINISAPVLTQEEVDHFLEYFAPIPIDEAGTRFKIMWEKVVKYRGPGMTLEMAAISMAENLRGGERYEDGHKAAFEHSRSYVESISKIKQALWVMNLGDDLFEHTKRVDSYLRNGSRTDFPDWGHGCLELHAEEFANQVLSFFND